MRKCIWLKSFKNKIKSNNWIKLIKVNFKIKCTQFIIIKSQIKYKIIKTIKIKILIKK